MSQNNGAYRPPPVPSIPGGPAVVARPCANCGEPLRPEQRFCVRCGTPVLAQQAAAPTPVTQLAPIYGGAPVYTPSAPQAPPVAMPVMPPSMPPVPPQNQPQPPAPQPPAPRRAQRERQVVDLGVEFNGLRPATTGRRVLAYSIDVVAVTVIAAIVWVATSSVVYGMVVALELVIGLVAWQATKGLTLGNLLLRIRTTRDDRPFTPGIGRGFARSGVTAAGFLVGAAGGWVLTASSAWDPSGKNRGWQDRVAGTLTVAVPARPAAVAPAAAAAVATAGFAPQATGPAGYQAPQVSSTRMLVAEPQGEGQREQAVAPPRAAPAAATQAAVSPAPQAVTQLAPQPAQADPAPAVPVMPSLVPPVPTTAQPAVSAIQPASASTTPAPTPVGSLLFMFDTGQRETVVSPGSGYLGRNPTATSLGEQVISVQDPDKSVSKVHLHFEARGAQLWITDQGSTNGTDLIDDEGQVVALSAGERVEVPAGSRVRLGDRTFAVSVIPSS
jgi:hypothetical protein